MSVSERHKLLIVDDIEEYLVSLKNALGGEFDITIAHTRQEGEDKMDASFDLVLADVRLDEDDPDNREGLHLLEWCREEFPDVPVVVMSAYTDFDVAVEAVNLGASYFFKKPIEIAEAKPLLKKIIRGEEIEDSVTPATTTAEPSDDSINS